MKNEATHIARCLDALARQQNVGEASTAGSFGVLLFANNCSDESPNIARAIAQRAPFEIRVVERLLPRSRAHAGGARREAMELANRWLLEVGTEDGAILTTDADSRVPPHWIASNLAAISVGADAVLGRVALDEEGAALPAALHERGRLEGEYEELLCEISALFDPADHNPWPHHATISGASLGVTRQMYRRVGGLPSVPLGEDKAFIATLLRHDARLRFAPEIEVVTSGRTSGRAPGGVADTLRLRAENPELHCDESLEPFGVAIKRARWRGQLRTIWRSGSPKGSAWPLALGCAAALEKLLSDSSTFGAAWIQIEAGCPGLARRLLTPADLPRQIEGATRTLRRLRKLALESDQYVDPEITVPLLARDSGDGIHIGDETFGSLVAG
jgi:Glycosyl transferase family 2